MIEFTDGYSIDPAGFERSCADRATLPGETKHSPEDCPDCRRVREEDRRLKKHLKRAVGREDAPESLIRSIKKRIRR